MALSKKAKLWITLLSIPVVLLLAGAVAAKLYFTSERLKSLILPEIEQSTRRTVSVREISLSLFPSLSISLDGLSISNRRGARFERDEFLSLDRLQLKVKLLELLRNKLEITYIILDHPKIYLETTEEGVKNSAGDPANADTVHLKVERSSTGALLLSNLEIIGGEIEQVDKKFNSHMVIRGLHLTANAEARPGERPIFITSSAAIDGFSYGSLKRAYLSDQPVKAEVKLRYDPTADVLTLETAALSIRELLLSITGTVGGLTAKEMRMDLLVTSPGTQMAQLLSILPPELLKSAKGFSSAGEVKFTMSVKGISSETMNPGIAGSFTVTDGKIQYASLPKAITNVTLAGSFDEPAAPVGATGIGAFAIEKMGATIGGNDLGGSMRVVDFTDPSLTAKFAGLVNLGEVKEFYPLELGSEFGGMVRVSVAVAGKPKNPQTLKASGSIEFQNVTVKTAGSPRPLTNLNGTVTVTNQLCESKRLAMTVGESDMTLAFTLKNYLSMVMEGVKTAAKPTASVSLTSHQLRTADLMAESPSPGAGGGGAKKPAKGGGLLPGIDIDATLAVDKLVTEKFLLTNARGSVSVSGGIVTLNNFGVNAFNGTVLTKGTLDLRDPNRSPFNFDLDIKSVESNSLLSNFTSFGQYLFGKFSTSTKLQGDLNDTLGLNPQSLLGNGTVDITGGKLLGFPLMQKLSEFTSLSELREINFSNWTNAFSIANGRLAVKDLKITSSAAEFVVGGSQGLDGSMDYSLTVKLPAAVSDRISLGGAGGQLLELFKDKEGRINLPLNVSGSSTSPVVRLDAKAQEEAAKNALQQKVDESKKKLEEELKKKAAEGLKNLFKKP
jgi:uncharacterized protein involved in outer membrane biogenesis